MSYGVFAGIVGIVCNLLLFAAKGIIGLLSGSIAVLADAFNNMTDAVSSIISLIGAKLANRPPDDEHPFGQNAMNTLRPLLLPFLYFRLVFHVPKVLLAKSFTGDAEFQHSITGDFAYVCRCESMAQSV